MKLVKKWLRWLSIVLLIGIFGILCGIQYSKRYLSQISYQYIISSVADVPDVVFDVVIILGARTYQDGRLSPVLRDRVDLALELYRQGKARKILISWDNGTQQYNEIRAIYTYVQRFDIPDEDIFVDFAGFDTQDSMYRARHNFQIETMIIPTQQRFINRTVFLAWSYGIASYGIITPYSYEPYLPFGRHAREDFASVKAFYEWAIKRKAKIASDDRYPITGTGNAMQFFSPSIRQP